MVDPGYEHRLTDREKREILILDEQIAKLCPEWGTKQWGQ